MYYNWKHTIYQRSHFSCNISESEKKEEERRMNLLCARKMDSVDNVTNNCDGTTHHSTSVIMKPKTQLVQQRNYIDIYV